jgi:2-dehydro-3-deoxygalactonokinase
VAGALSSGEGAALLYNQWVAGGRSEKDRESIYLTKLAQHIGALSEKLAINLDGIPVVMSGMIGSSVGIRELPYAPLPFAMDGSGAVVQELAVGKELSRAVWLISGVGDRRDVMRGEETQLIGLASMDSEMSKAGSAVCVMPGTHSKHIRTLDGAVVGIKTFMTGELFHVLRHYSILKDSVAGDSYDALPDDNEKAAFLQGVHQSGNEELLHSLFVIRVNQLMGASSKRENFFHLSGLLIGTELRSLGYVSDGPIRLCSGSAVFHLYRLAIEDLGLLPRTVLIPPDAMERSAAAGQARILKNITG